METLAVLDRFIRFFVFFVIPGLVVFIGGVIVFWFARRRR